MVKFQFIVPVDGSDYSEVAIKHAIRMAEMYNAEISPIYVVDSRIHKDEESVKEQTAIGQSLVDTARDQCKNHGIGVLEAKVLTGSPHNEIVRMQKAIDASLIILGACGADHTDGETIGSIAERVLRGARCHVLLVRDKLENDDFYKNVLIPSDGSLDAKYAATFAASIAHRYNVSLTVCSMIHTGSKRDLADAEQIAADVVSLGKAKGVETDSLIWEGKPAVEILKAINTTKTDLTVIGYTGKGRVSRWILGSVSERVARTAPCSVFVVKSARAERVYSVS
ncbi:MAG: universal stress protein [Methanosarcinales archaeon]|nr:MAG: universal stress protein [Methanosarcinales archaeon]